MSGTTPELADLLQQAVEAQLFELHVAMPGQVTAVHADASSGRQFVDVRPCLRRALPVEPYSGLPGPYAEEELPIIPRVPVGYPQGGGFAITWPLRAGDFVLLVFCERSIDHWLATASKSQQTTTPTSDLGLHTLDGAVALPLGPAPTHELLQHVSPSALTLGAESGKRIEVSETKVMLGSSTTTDTVALASKTNTALTSGETDLGTLKAATSVAIKALESAVSGGTSTTIGAAFDLAVTAIPHAHTSVASTVVGAE